MKTSFINPLHKLLHAYVLALLLVVTVFVSLTSAPRAVAGQSKADRPGTTATTTIRMMIPAPSLESDLFGVSQEQPYIIFLPSSYDSSNLRYPVIYFLHGFSTTVDAFRYLFSTMISLDDTIVVLVSGHHNIIGGTYYTDSPVTGNWEHFVASDVVSFTDSNFRTVREPRFRGIAGLSMGGYGALNVAMKYPEVFGSAYAISPGLFDEDGLSKTVWCTDSMINYYIGLENELTSLDATTAHERYLSLLGAYSPSDTRRITLAYGSAFSPNLVKGAPYIDYPFFNDTSGEITRNETIWEIWEKGFGGVDEEIQLYKENLLSLAGIGIEYAANDNNVWIPEGCIYYSQKLAAEGINHTLIETSYGHGESLDRRIREYMLPFFMSIFGKRVRACFSLNPSVPRVDQTVLFDASASTPSEGAITGYEWDFGDGNVTVTTSPTATHAYGSRSNYTVTLVATDSSGSRGLAWSNLSVLMGDVSMVGVSMSTNWTYVGRAISIGATVMNEGDFVENLSITVRCNSIAIGEETISDLPPGSNATVTFEWNTIGLEGGSSYIVVATVTPVPFELEVENNSLVGGEIMIRLAGDVNGDGIVNMTDLYILSTVFGKIEEDAFNSEIDLNLDGIVNMFDLFLVASNFGTCA